ncbi:hypothetical protein F5882DRAFT_466171 [Hyaloscypha sp. PMI_1271]|nr:hypothetical protein F5882DRAFT_466171 [Hyaloscypha sp. PMI_1271]
MHAIQTRSKTRLETFLAKTVIEVERRCSEVSKAWDASVEKKDLIRQIDEKVLIQESIFIDSAICLGLGPLELHPETYAEYYDVEEDMWAYCVYESKKFKLDEVSFQDPSFSLTDVKFLEQRGYRVLPFDWGQTKIIEYHEYGEVNKFAGLDQSLRPLLSTSMMVFAPYLPLPCLYDLVHTGKPSLYFGTCLLRCITGESPSITKVSFPADDFVDFVTTYEDELEVTALRDATESDFRSCPLVLTWSAIASDRDAMIRLQNRRLRVEKAKEERAQGKLVPDSEIELADSESGNEMEKGGEQGKKVNEDD